MPRAITQACKRRIHAPSDEERRADEVDKQGGMARSGGAGRSKEVLACINDSAVTPLVNSLIGEFDAPADTVVAFLPVSKPDAKGQLHAGSAPFFDASMHMDGSTPGGKSRHGPETTNEEVYWDYVHRYGPDGGTTGRDGENGACFSPIGKPGHSGLLFMDEDCSLSTGSFTLFAVVCLNDQRQPGRGQFTLARGYHHAMESFYRMQQDRGGIIGPEGPGWPRLDPESPNRSSVNQIPKMVQDLFMDEHARPSADGRLWPRPAQMCMAEGDLCLCLHTIPHSGSRNENGPEPRQNLIWRLRAKVRQPSYYHAGDTDHPDRLFFDPTGGPSGLGLATNGAWLEVPQDEPEYFPGEQGNDPHERSKYSLTHMWHEFPGMQSTVARKHAEEAASGVYPVGAGPDAVAAFSARVEAEPEPVPTTPKGAREFWARYEEEHGKPQWYLEKEAALASAVSSKL